MQAAAPPALPSALSVSEEVERVNSSRENEYIQCAASCRPLRLDTDANTKLFTGVDPLPSRGSPTPTNSSTKGFFKDTPEAEEPSGVVPGFDSLKVTEDLGNLPSMAAASVVSGNALKTKKVAAVSISRFDVCCQSNK